MTQSAIWDALLVVGDCLADRRFDAAEAVLAELDAMDAWAWASHLTSCHRTAADRRNEREIRKLVAHVARFGGAPDALPIGIPVVLDEDCPPNRAYVLTDLHGQRRLYVHPSRTRRASGTSIVVSLER